MQYVRLQVPKQDVLWFQMNGLSGLTGKRSARFHSSIIHGFVRFYQDTALNP